MTHDDATNFHRAFYKKVENSTNGYSQVYFSKFMSGDFYKFEFKQHHQDLWYLWSV